jgi:hypothetical protein
VIVFVASEALDDLERIFELNVALAKRETVKWADVVKRSGAKVD